MEEKLHDIITCHTNAINQMLHLISSTIFCFCYIYAFFNFENSVYLCVLALFIRQIGHYIFEPNNEEGEKKLLGVTTKDKLKLISAYAVSGLVSHYLLDELASMMFYTTLIFILNHISSFRSTNDILVWTIKLATDPITDVYVYSKILFIESKSKTD